MDNKNRIIECCNMAIRKGFGNYFVMHELTWVELKEGLQSGKKLTPESEKEIQGKIVLLGKKIRMDALDNNSESGGKK